MRAVIFDLWDTLVEWPVEEARKLTDGLAGHVGVGREEFDAALAGELPRLADTGRSPRSTARSASRTSTSPGTSPHATSSAAASCGSATAPRRRSRRCGAAG